MKTLEDYAAVTTQKTPTPIALSAQQVINPRYTLIPRYEHRVAIKPMPQENPAIAATVPTPNVMR